MKSLSVAANGVVAAILEDGDVTWINVYNPTGEKSSRNQNDDAEIRLSGFRVIVGQWKTDDGGISESRKRQYGNRSSAFTILTKSDKTTPTRW